MISLQGARGHQYVSGNYSDRSERLHSPRRTSTVDILIKKSGFGREDDSKTEATTDVTPKFRLVAIFVIADLKEYTSMFTVCRHTRFRISSASGSLFIRTERKTQGSIRMAGVLLYYVLQNY